MASLIPSTTVDRTLLPDGRPVIWVEIVDSADPYDGTERVRFCGMLDGREVAFMSLRAEDHFAIYVEVSAALRGTGLGLGMYQAALLRYGSIASVYGRRCPASDRLWADAEQRGWTHHCPEAVYMAKGSKGVPPVWHPSMEHLTLAGEAVHRSPVHLQVLQVVEAGENVPGRGNPWWPGRRIVRCRAERGADSFFPHETAVVGDEIVIGGVDVNVSVECAA